MMFSTAQEAASDQRGLTDNTRPPPTRVAQDSSPGAPIGR